MRDHGVKVLTVRDILSFGAEDHVGARVELEDLAMKVPSTCLSDAFSIDRIRVPT